MLAYYGSQISPHLVDTPEGFLICKDVPIARTGEQEYLARELMLDGDPERPVTVQRRPEDVFAPAALASFEGKPVTDGHPPESVGAENYAAYAKGHVQNVRRQGDYVTADYTSTTRPWPTRCGTGSSGRSPAGICAITSRRGRDTGRSASEAITSRSCRKAGRARRLRYKTPPQRRRKAGTTS